MSEYSGWTNYSTWCVGLWIDNEPSTYETLCEMARECLECDDDPGDYSGDPGHDAEFKLADRLKDWIDSEDSPFGPPPENGPWADFVNSALAEVNWYELAEHYIEEAKE